MSEEISTAHKKAEELGEYIEKTEIFKQYKRIHEELISDEEAKKLLQEHQEMFMKIYTPNSEQKQNHQDTKTQSKLRVKNYHEQEQYI